MSKTTVLVDEVSNNTVEIVKGENKVVATLKKVWKPLAIGAGVLTAGIIGAAIGKSSKHDEYDEYDFDEAVDADDSADELAVENF